ncbi:Lipoprotein signal peptidase [Frankliniella fusca]|uniref:Lipoprotein signal peptidase n=1 Tax=Frankliniella fusca TaxID=407009 RepID=A0AAE1H3K9_9NEOP|nr:Lipoprotein signal peptidase [Frankliniella fusca]
MNISIFWVLALLKMLNKEKNAYYCRPVSGSEGRDPYGDPAPSTRLKIGQPAYGLEQGYGTPASGLRITELSVPAYVDVGDSAELVCHHELQDATLLSVKWYKDESEFFRYTPGDVPDTRTFPLAGVNLDLASRRSSDTKVTLTQLSSKSSGVYRCEVSADAPKFETVHRESRMEVMETNFALQLKGWRENMENFCGSKPPEGGCGSRQAQGFYPLWQPTASVFHGNRRFADCDPIAQFDRFDPRTTIGLPLEVRAVSRALDFLNPVSEALPQRGTRDSNPQPRVPTRSQNRKRPNAQSHRANGVLPREDVKIHGVEKAYSLGTVINATCKADRSKPKADLQWFINGQPARHPLSTHSFEEVKLRFLGCKGNLADAKCWNSRGAVLRLHISR